MTDKQPKVPHNMACTAGCTCPCCSCACPYCTFLTLFDQLVTKGVSADMAADVASSFVAERCSRCED